MTEEVPEPLPPLTKEERKLIAGLSDEQRRAIDEALLAAVIPRWRKVAFVVANVMYGPNHIAGLPVTYYGLRVQALVEQGRIEAQGNVEYLRFSEVRLPSEH